MIRLVCTVSAMTKASALFKPWYGGIGSILMFHRVVSLQETGRSQFNWTNEVTTEHLENCIVYLKKNNYSLVSLDDIHSILLGREKPAKRVVAITFDDGYADNLTLALPIFKKHNVPFAIYISSCFPEKNAVLWWYLLEDLIVTKDHLNFEIGEIIYDFPCRTMLDKTHAFHIMRNIILNSVSRTDLLLRLRQIFEPHGVDLYHKTEELALDWRQIQQLGEEQSVTIGAHTLNHLSLGKLSDSDAEEEIAGSKKILEAKLGRQIPHFAYPFGGVLDAGTREFELVKKYGFDTAVTTRTGNLFPLHAEHLNCLPRIAVNGETGRRNNLFLDVSMNVIPALNNKLKRMAP